jgi:citrate lyase subunit beta/citryl-CoA lyase
MTMRSKLFVPGARPDFFEKALRGDADALSFDLEDAVAEDGKPAARARLAEFLASDAVRASAKTIIVRVNAYGSQNFETDLAALARVHLHLINLPKIENAKVAGAAANQIAQIFPQAELLLNIETARGLARASEIAAAHQSVAGLQIGLNDLFDPLRIDRTDPWNVRAVMWQVRMSAAEADVFAYDGAWPRLDDDAGFRREAEMACSMGFYGKSCIHPRQVTIANKVFDRSHEVADARRVVEAARAAATTGKGAFLLDGKMIDAPAIAQAEAVLRSVGDAK